MLRMEIPEPRMVCGRLNCQSVWRKAGKRCRREGEEGKPMEGKDSEDAAANALMLRRGRPIVKAEEEEEDNGRV